MKKKEKSDYNFIERFVIRQIFNRIIKYIMKKSWKTSLAGWASLVAGVALALVALIDGDPTTKPDTEQIGQALGALGIAIPTWLGFLFSRDNNVTSEEAKAK